MVTQFAHYPFPDRKSLTTALALHIAAALTGGIKKNGLASLAVSGGSTPLPLFDRLSTLELPWQHVHITLVDERWVEISEKDSNENLVRTHLLRNLAAKANFTGMKNRAVTATGGENECEKQLRKIPRPFDLLLLGMGNDGHTASLFPGAEKLSQATAMDSGRICMAIAPPTAPHERMSHTLPAILDSAEIILHITGKQKKEVLEKAMREGESREMPIRFILHQQKTPLSIYWAP